MTCTFTPAKDLTTEITKLTIIAKIKNEYWAGTDDDIYISFNNESDVDLFCKAPRVGQNISIDIDLPRVFGAKSLRLGQLTRIVLHQLPGVHPIASDDWELESLTIIVNDIFSNISLNKINEWITTTSSHYQIVWSGYINRANWCNSDGRPIDLNAHTYPVRWMPYLADLKSWRTYDPSKIDGAGQLVGMIDGHLIGTILKNNKSEIIESNGPNDSYTWVYTPEGSIIYKRWNHALRADYTRHSQLGSGKPVICAGEFRINRMNKSYVIEDIVTMVNDASGHYQPDGRNCLQYVSEKLEALGLDMSQTRWSWKSTPS
ncbi:hypothetical protein [Pseudomonas sp. IT-P4]|jgi:hypothetical protein|uniref:hypothetical protein n=1 Tax=Pseudomonas sp. IT-P4 TaxID=3026446 RepID=UPI0039E16F52